MLRPEGEGWRLRVEPVGAPGELLGRLRAEAAGAPVALGIDCPIGLPRAYVAGHGVGDGFLAFLRGLAARPGWFQVAETLAEVGGERPFYPRRGVAGMTRAGHAAALGFTAAGLCRACDRATAERPAGAPMFWTLGANQSGKAAISAWREVLIPALAGERVAVWPFEGRFRALLRPGWVAVAEAYPADALRQLGVRLAGSKRRQADRAGVAGALAAAMARLGVAGSEMVADGFGGTRRGRTGSTAWWGRSRCWRWCGESGATGRRTMRGCSVGRGGCWGRWRYPVGLGRFQGGHRSCQT